MSSTYVSVTGVRDFDAVTRVVSRLHAVRAEVVELHLAGNAVCVHLRDPALQRRVQSVLQRLVGLEAESSCRCSPPLRTPSPTRCVAWSTPSERVPRARVAS